MFQSIVLWRSKRDSNCEPLSDAFVNFSQLKAEARRSAMDRNGGLPPLPGDACRPGVRPKQNVAMAESGPLVASLPSET